jgi:hypothetical protein
MYLPKQSTLPLTYPVKKRVEHIQGAAFSNPLPRNPIIFTEACHACVISKITIDVHLADDDMVQQEGALGFLREMKKFLVALDFFSRVNSDSRKSSPCVVETHVFMKDRLRSILHLMQLAEAL